MNSAEFAELKVRLDNIHEDVRQLMGRDEMRRTEMEILRGEMSQHRVYFKLVGGLLFLLLGGAGGVAGLTKLLP